MFYERWVKNIILKCCGKLQKTIKMKKLLFLVIVSSILLIACSAPFFALGTSEEMFLKKSPGSKLIEKIVKERYILEDGV